MHHSIKMVLLNDDEPTSREVSYIESWSREFDTHFMERMATYGWSLENTHIVPPPGGEWWILCVRSNDKYQYVSDVNLYNPIYEIYFHGFCAAKIKVEVFRSSTHYNISWSDHFSAIREWQNIAGWLKSNDYFHLIQDFLVGRRSMDRCQN